MSDLLFTPTGLTSPPVACYEDPPAPVRGVPQPDGCHIEIPFVEEEALGTPRMVRFDRLADQFVLSPANTVAIREWFESHSNTTQIFTMLRLFNGMIRLRLWRPTPEHTRFILNVAQYVATGNVREVSSGERTDYEDLDVSQGILQIFADSDSGILGLFLGQFQVLRRGSWLSSEALDRLRQLTSMIDMVPQFRAFRLHLLSETDLENRGVAGRTDSITALNSFAARVVAADSLSQPLRFDPDFLSANDAYQALYGSEIEAGSRPDFCTVLEEAIRELRGMRGGADGPYIQECRLALTLRERSPEEALRDTFRTALTSAEGLRALQAVVEEESAEANMTVEWLAERGDEDAHGRIGEVLRVVMQNLTVGFPEDESLDPELSLNVPALRVALQTLIDAHSTMRREYVLASLAILRRLAGEDATVRVYVRDHFQELSLVESTDRELSSLIPYLESQLEASHEGSDIWLPILEGTACAIGVAGLFVSELIPEVRRDAGFRVGIGTTSAGLGGAGCASLLGHFIWPEVTGDVRNSYMWDGFTALGGAAIGIVTYLLVHFLGGSNPMMDPGDRFPTDEYGP